MQKIEWTEELEVGVEMIDTQHHALIDIANNVIEAAEKGEDKEAVDKTITKLREYTVFHFNEEEKMMEEIRYPKRGEQLVEHSRLKREVKDYQRLLYKRKEVSPDEIQTFVTEWFFGHILTFDQELSNFINKTDEQEDVKEDVIEDAREDAKEE